MRDCKYALEIMKQELDNKHISPEIKYAFLASIDALEKQLNNGWIPCSKELPKTSNYVLVTYENGEVDFIWYNADDQIWIDGNDMPMIFEDSPNVIAWQPLPEPYKEVSE